MTFDQTWNAIRAKLKPGQVIPNWTQLKGELGDTFRVVEAKSDLIAVETPGSDTIQKVPRKDFEAVSTIWDGYKAGTVRRDFMTPLMTQAPTCNVSGEMPSTQHGRTNRARTLVKVANGLFEVEAYAVSTELREEPTILAR